MNTEQAVKIFDDMGGENYDKNNMFFRPVLDNLQLLNQLILKDLPKNAHILCVGVGTGSDILQLAESNPNWSFVGIEPSKSMLGRCETKLSERGLMKRSELFHGFLSEYKSDKKFDAVLCLFVMHFIKNLDERSKMFMDFGSFLKKDGFLINAEISVDVKSTEYEYLIENWKSVHALAGASDEKLNDIPNVIGGQLGVLSPEITKDLIIQNGFRDPIHFFQSFLIRGWYSRKA